MKRIIFFTIAVLLTISTLALADDSTTTETCADGAGVVITGAVSNHKYCRSNQLMNWWNAIAWCDGLGMKLFGLNEDCACSDAVANCFKSKCPELTNVIGDKEAWSMTPIESVGAFVILSNSGNIMPGQRINGRTALCR